MMKNRILFIYLCIVLLAGYTNQACSQKKAVIAYYSGSLAAIDSFQAKKFTHIIYCFGHLKDNKLVLRGSKDTLLIQKMVAEQLKVGFQYI